MRGSAQMRIGYLKSTRACRRARIAKQLRAEGQRGGKKRVARVMRVQGLRAKATPKYKATTHSNPKLPVAPNLFSRHPPRTGNG